MEIPMSETDGKVVFTTKELLEKIDGKLDRLDTKLDSKADQLRVEAMIDSVRQWAKSEIARVEALVTPLIDPQHGVYAAIEASSKKMDGKTITALGAIVMMLAGILFKKYIGLA
jgi:hypothetical protein